MGSDAQDLAGLLRQAGVTRGDLVGLVAIAGETASAGAASDEALPGKAVPGKPTVAVALGTPGRQDTGPAAAVRGWVTSPAEVARADEQLRPRWVTWSGETAARLAADRVRLATCWDVTAVHRLLFGGWRADPGWAWAHLHGLPLDAVPASKTVPAIKPGELFGATGELDDDEPDATGSDDPFGPGGYLRPAWLDVCYRRR